ncbi:MAG: hypothetical protein WBA87_01470 [Microbacterium sp.]
MPTSRRPLPEELGPIFTVADAREQGIGPSRLSGGDLAAPFHGMRVRLSDSVTAGSSGDGGTDAVTDDPRRFAHLQRMQEFLPVLGSTAFFCGPSAAFYWRIPLPPRDWTDLHVGRYRPNRPPRRAGVQGHKFTTGFVTVVEIDGLRLTDPASTWATLGVHLNQDDLTAAADRILRVPRYPGGFQIIDTTPLAVRADLEQAADRKGRPAAPKLRRALADARTGSSSPPETRIRLLIRDAGLREPVLDHDVYDGRGRWLGCSELAYPDLKIAIEYESDGHLTREQLQRDIDKYQAYAEAGWQTVRLTSQHVFHEPAEAIRRIRSAVNR